MKNIFKNIGYALAGLLTIVLPISLTVLFATFCDKHQQFAIGLGIAVVVLTLGMFLGAFCWMIGFLVVTKIVDSRQWENLMRTIEKRKLELRKRWDI